MDKKQLDLQKQIIREEYITEMEVNERANEIIKATISGHPGITTKR